MSDNLRKRIGRLDVVRSGDEGPITYRATISTETPVPGPRSPREVLSHEPGAVDLTEANEKGLVIRAEHQGLPAGRAYDFEIVGRELVAKRIELAPSHEHLRADIDGGFLRDVSVGAFVRRSAWKIRGRDLVATKWKPAELSFVSIPGDSGATIHRTGDNEMSDSGSDHVARAEAIGAIYKGLDGPEWLERQIKDLGSDDDVEVIRTRVLDQLKSAADATPRIPAGHVSAGADQLDKFIDECQRSLDYRCGNMAAEDREKFERNMWESDVAHLTLREMGREYLRRRNLPTTGTDDQMIERSLGTPAVMRAQFGMGSSDLANVLAVTSDKSLARGYSETPETYRSWVQNKTVPNFRAHDFPNLSSFGELLEVPESGTYQEAVLADRKEMGSAKEWARKITLTRKMMLNDDLGALSSLPAAMGRASARRIGNLVYAVLTANAAMNEDSENLFSAAHGNLAGTGGAIAKATLAAARLALRTQTAPDPGRGETGATLNIVPRFLLTPAALETDAETFLASRVNPAEGSTTAFEEANVIRNLFELLVEPRLDASSATAWYVLAAANAGVETVSVLWLNGVQRPVLAQETGFLNGAITYGIRIDAGAAALDYRGLYKNAGA